MKFTVVTPAFNAEKFISETIESVIKQKGDFSIEYIVLDNCSTDNTCSIVKKYQDLLIAGEAVIFCREVRMLLFSESDLGMYDAIKKGFSRATGDIFAWINSDDIYLPGAFAVIERTLGKYPQIRWLKGITSYISEPSTIFAVGRCNFYRQDWIRAGVYGPVLHFIQQDSVFWRAELWQESGGVNKKMSLAGDYFLWKSFAELAPLCSLNAYVSCFRRTVGQKSADIHAYWQEINTIARPDKRLARKLDKYFARIESLPRVLRRFVFDWAFGRYLHHLVTLDKGGEPQLWVRDYFSLMDMV